MEVLQRTANRGSISTGEYEIANSLKFEADNSEELSRNVSSTGSRTTATVSMWIKRTELGAAQYLFTYGNTDNDNGRTLARFQSDDTLRIMGGNTTWRNTNRKFRDTSASYHIVIAFDTTQSTANDRIKLYINGVQETSFSTTNNPSEDGILGLNFQKQVIGYNSIDGGSYFSGYMTEIVHQEGTASAPTEFGEFDADSGIWKPKAFSGSYGTNGFYLDFEDNTSAGKDTSGNNNNFSDTNLNAADHATDTPTNNFAIYNQLIPKDEFIIYQGGTRTQKTTATRWRTAASTLAVANGKWYAEFQNSLYSATGTNRIVGVAPASIFTESSSSTGGYLGGNSTETTDSIGFYSINGRYYINGNSFVWGNTWTADEIIGVALDMDNGYVYFSINGTWQNSGDPTSGSSGTGGIALQLSDEAHYIAGSIYNSNAQLEVNYGGFTVMSIASGNADANGYGTFEYAPPSGYYALCTKNLAEYG